MVAAVQFTLLKFMLFSVIISVLLSYLVDYLIDCTDKLLFVFYSLNRPYMPAQV